MGTQSPNSINHSYSYVTRKKMKEKKATWLRTNNK
jgi:hypothetical protein